MLFAISLAQMIGVKHNLQAFSLHPGVIWTNLGSHIDWSVEMDGLRMISNPHKSFVRCGLTNLS